MAQLTPTESNRNRRARLVAILSGSRRRAEVAAGVSALVAAGPLAPIDAATFGLYNSPSGSAECSIAAGSAVLSSTDAPFSASDAGKAIGVAGAGVAGAVLSTTILSFSSPGSVTLAAAAATTVAASATSAAGVAVWGWSASQKVPADPQVDSAGNALEPNPGNPDLTAAPVVAAGSNTPRTLAARCADRVNVRDFGAAGDNATDDYSAIQAAASFASTSRRALYFPAGIYLCSGRVLIGGHCAILGDGLATSRIVFTAANCGVLVTLAPQGAGVPPEQCVVNGITLESRAAVVNAALHIYCTGYQPTAQDTVFISDVQVTRKNDGTGSFVAGIHLNNIFNAFIDRCLILGDDARVSQMGIYLLDCVGVRVAHTDINRYQFGARAVVASAVQTEGVSFTDCGIYDCNRGVYVNKGIHVSVANTHININGLSAVSCIELVQVSQSFVNACLFYYGGSPGDAAGQQAVVLNACSAVMVAASVINATTPANALRAIMAYGGTGFCTIVGCNFSFGQNGVCFNDASTDYNQLIGCQFYSVTTPIVDAGPSNHRALNLSGNAPISELRWGPAAGNFRAGEMSANAIWGAYLRGYSGSSADIALADSGGTVALSVLAGTARVRSAAKASLPTPAAGALCYVTDDVGGATLAFADGTNWRRVADRAIVA